MTSEMLEWDPNTDRFETQEEAMLNSKGLLKDTPQNWGMKRIVAALHTIPQEVPPDNLLGIALEGMAYSKVTQNC